MKKKQKATSVQLKSGAEKFAIRRNTFCQRLGKAIAILPSGNTVPGADNIMPNTPINSDFYYLTGLEEPNTIAILSGVHPHKYILFFQEANQHDQIWYGPKMTCHQLKKFASADMVYPYDELDKYILPYLENIETIYYPMGFEDDLFYQINKIRLEQCQVLSSPQIFPYQICDLQNIIQDMRLYKESTELNDLRHAVTITCSAIEKIMQTPWHSHSEYEIKARLQFEYSNALCSNAFAPIVATGINSTILHYTKDQDKILDGQLLLIDTGACFKHYCADITRTWPVSGEFTREQLMVYEAVLYAQSQAIAEIRPGNPVPNFHWTAVSALVTALLEFGILSGDKKEIIMQKKFADFYPHSTGHWLGLDVHDQVGGYYDRDTPRTFQPGMVLTVEPGLYFSPHRKKILAEFCGIGIRIEDDILVTQNGHEVLTEALPKQVADVQKLLKKRLC